jgi:hypothetical protein
LTFLVASVARRDDYYSGYLRVAHVGEHFRERQFERLPTSTVEQQR